MAEDVLVTGMSDEIKHIIEEWSDKEESTIRYAVMQIKYNMNLLYIYKMDNVI